MRVSAIVAMAANRVIGADNRLPWRLPADLARFKRLTLGHTLVMGRRTYESIGRPLPGRRTVVLTRQLGWRPRGVEVACNLEQALALAGGGTVYVSGGGEVYAQSLPLVQRLHLTLLDWPVPGDTTFPEVHPAEWVLVREVRRPAPPGLPGGYAFLTYERKREAAR